MGSENPKLEEDLKRISDELELEDYTPEELNKIVDSQKEKNLLTIQETDDEGMRMMFLTSLMAYKYIFELEQINPAFELNSNDEYNTDFSLEGDDLRKATHENIAKLQRNLDTANLTVGVNKDIEED